MGQFFEIKRSRHALSTTDDSITIDVPAGRKLKVHSLRADGGESAGGLPSAEVGVFRTSANGSGGSPTSLVIKPLDPNGSVPSGMTAKFGYTTQPTAEADPVVSAVFQPYGGTGSWPVVQGAPAEFWAVAAYQVSVRGINTTGSDTPQCSIAMTVELE